MPNLAPALVALVIDSGITALELLTSSYPRTYFVLTPKRCWALYAYGFIYGAIAFLATLFLDPLIESGTLRGEGLGSAILGCEPLLLG